MLYIEQDIGRCMVLHVLSSLTWYVGMLIIGPIRVHNRSQHRHHTPRPSDLGDQQIDISNRLFIIYPHRNRHIRHHLLNVPIQL